MWLRTLLGLDPCVHILQKKKIEFVDVRLQVVYVVCEDG